MYYIRCRVEEGEDVKSCIGLQVDERESRRRKIGNEMETGLRQGCIWMTTRLCSQFLSEVWYRVPRIHLKMDLVST